MTNIFRLCLVRYNLQAVFLKGPQGPITHKAIVFTADMCVMCCSPAHAKYVIGLNVNRLHLENVVG